MHAHYKVLGGIDSGMVTFEMITIFENLVIYMFDTLNACMLV